MGRVRRHTGAADGAGWTTTPADPAPHDDLDDAARSAAELQRIVAAG